MAEQGSVTEAVEEDATEDPEEEFYRVFNEKAEILTSTDMSAWGHVDRYRVIAQLKDNDNDYVAQTIRLAQGDKARVMTAVIGPSIFLQIGETLEETDEYLDIFRNLLIIMIAIFIAFSSAIGWLLARRSLAGMKAVTSAAEDITRGNYNRRVEVDGQLKEIEMIKIDFIDTGIGIAESDLPHIFQRFYRCDQSRSKRGVGLGLSLVKAYTESMKGVISVKSALNRGSVFSLSFAV